ncbi:MAG: CopD family protein [Actinomycetota bacterium]
MRRALVLAVLVALAAPASAFAHASIRTEWPAYRERMAFPPREVLIRFDQTVELLPNAIEVFDADGRNVAGRARLVDRGIVAPLQKLPKGPYTVRWKALSTDSHVVSGVYTFGVRVPAPNVSDAVGAQGPTRTEDLVRWLYFVGLALLTGGLGFELLVAPVRDRRRYWWLLGAGVVVTLEVGITAFLLRAEDALQLPFSAFLYGDLSPISGGTRFGQAFVVMELGFAIVSALVFLAWLVERRALLWIAFVLALGLGSGLSLSGHSSATTAQSVADWFHLSAATLWIGGLVQLALVRRDGLAFRRFSRLATVCVAVLVVAGTYLSIERLPALHDLWRTSYGHVLLIKLALVSVALLWGALHQFVVLPRIESAGGGLMRSLLAESAVAMAVLLVAAILVDSKPPEKPPRVPSAAHVAAHSR